MLKADTDKFYMDLAIRSAQNSYCTRSKVGAIMVTRFGGIYCGFNGTPSGADNVCEDINNTSLPWVVHAERNALLKMLKEGVSTEFATAYITLSPCAECTGLLYGAGILEVAYKESYRDISHFGYYENLGMKFNKLGE